MHFILFFSTIDYQFLTCPVRSTFIIIHKTPSQYRAPKLYANGVKTSIVRFCTLFCSPRGAGARNYYYNIDIKFTTVRRPVRSTIMISMCSDIVAMILYRHDNNMTLVVPVYIGHRKKSRRTQRTSSRTFVMIIIIWRKCVSVVHRTQNDQIKSAEKE